MALGAGSIAFTGFGAADATIDAAQLTVARPYRRGEQ